MGDERYVYVVTARGGEYEDDVRVVGAFDSMREALDEVGKHKFDVFANVESLTPREFLARAARGERTNPAVRWHLDVESWKGERERLVQPLAGVASFWPPKAKVDPDHVVLELRDDEYGTRITGTWHMPTIEIWRVKVGEVDYAFVGMPEHDDDRMPEPVDVGPSEFSFAVEQNGAIAQRLVEHINSEMRKLEKRLGRQLTEGEARDFAEGVFAVFFEKVDEEILLGSDEGKPWSLFNDERIGNGTDKQCDR